MPALFEHTYEHGDFDSALYTRGFVERITPTSTQRLTLIVAGCYVVAIGILWCAELLWFVLLDF